MSTSKTRPQATCVAPQTDAGGCHALSGVPPRWIVLAIGAYFCFGPTLLAQTSDSRTTEDPNQSWTATTDLKGNNVNPTRITESHTQTGDRALDTQSIQIRGFYGRFEPYQDIEKETVRLDASTVRTTTRSYGRGADGVKKLVQVTEEEQHTLPSGDSNVLRITSSPDLNGRLQPVRREIVETKNTGVDVEETDTTVMLQSVNSGFAPAVKTHEVRKRVANNSIETQETRLLPDGAGNWQVSEIRQNTTRQEANSRVSEDRVSRRDFEGNLVEASRVVSEESETASREKHGVVTTYSVDLPGRTRDGSLHLIERATTAQWTNTTGEQITEKKVEDVNPGDPSAGLRISALVNDTMRPGPSGEHAIRTIQMRDSNGHFKVVSVDTTKSDRVPTIQIQQTPSDKAHRSKADDSTDLK